MSPASKREPEPDLTEAALLRGIRRLELAARRNTVGLLTGDYLSSIRGQGMVFEEPRKYVPGDPARTIDWNITARTGEPYVRVYQEERQREVVIALDLSPSMHSGFQTRTKLEYAVELAATLAVAAIEGGDRAGWVLFADRALDRGRPMGGRRQLFRLLRALLVHSRPWRRPVSESDPRAAIHEIGRQRGRRRVIFLISDFIDHDIPEDLKFLRARHDVSLLHVFDPVEYATKGDAVLTGFSPERDSSPGWLRPGDTGSMEKMRRFLSEACARQRIVYSSFSTAAPVAPALGRFFRRKRRITA